MSMRYAILLHLNLVTPKSLNWRIRDQVLAEAEDLYVEGAWTYATE